MVLDAIYHAEYFPSFRLTRQMADILEIPLEQVTGKNFTLTELMKLAGIRIP